MPPKRKRHSRWGRGRPHGSKPVFCFKDGGAARRDAGTKAFEVLLLVWASCKKLTAKDFCIICGYMQQCGVPGGRWSTYALRPGLSSGRYKKEMNKHLPTGGPFYTARMPASLGKAAHEHSRLVPFRQIFASVAAEVNAPPEIREALEHGEWDDPNSVMS